MKIFNLNADEWDRTEEREGWRFKDAWVGAHTDAEQQLRQGDVVAFPRGKEGAHQIRNDTDAPVRVLMLSTLIAPDVVEYLDTGKIGARSVAGERIIFARPGPELEYWEDEDSLGDNARSPGPACGSVTRRAVLPSLG